MPWQEVTPVSERQEFVRLATAPGANVSALCRRFGISGRTGHKWLNRFREEGPAGLEARSRRPHASPAKVTAELETKVLELRAQHPAWGGRKLRARLLALGEESVPAASTITAILRRHGQLDENRREKRDWQRFEHDTPNRLWQMDFKGHFGTEAGRCHPLTLLDDHSRYALCLKALGNEQATSVQAALTDVFRVYGLPERILADRGSPWGVDVDSPYTGLVVWLLRLGIKVSHGRPYHPQTQGKEERFHRTLNAEVLRYEAFRDLVQCQARFDTWREQYNHERPHEALGMSVPASRYQVSWRAFPEELPPIEYGPGDEVRKVNQDGRIGYKGRIYRVGKGFKGLPVALRPTNQDGLLEVYFCSQQVTSIDLREH